MSTEKNLAIVASVIFALSEFAYGYFANQPTQNIGGYCYGSSGDDWKYGIQ